MGNHFGKNYLKIFIKQVKLICFDNETKVNEYMNYCLSHELKEVSYNGKTCKSVVVKMYYKEIRYNEMIVKKMPPPFVEIVLVSYGGYAKEQQIYLL